MVKAGSSSAVSTDDDGSAANFLPAPSAPSGGFNDFFAFYAQLQQSCQFYSNMALRQMMVGYQYPTGIGRRSGGDAPEEEGMVGTSLNSSFLDAKYQVYPTSHVAPTPKVRVVVSAYDADDNETDAAVNADSTLRQRKVNFADPLSTIKIKSPTPIHSMEELHGGHADGSKTGFTSDSEIEGSDTDLFCNYVWRVQNGLTGHLKVPPANTGVGGVSKKKKRRKKKKNKGSRQEEADTTLEYDYTTWALTPDECLDEDNVHDEVPPNEDDYEFVSEIRLCGPPTNKPKASKNECEGENNAASEKITQMNFLYGESGSVRILKMEERIEQCFMDVKKRIED